MVVVKQSSLMQKGLTQLGDNLFCSWWSYACL